MTSEPPWMIFQLLDRILQSTREPQSKETRRHWLSWMWKACVRKGLNIQGIGYSVHDLKHAGRWNCSWRTEVGSPIWWCESQSTRSMKKRRPTLNLLCRASLLSWVWNENEMRTQSDGQGNKARTGKDRKGKAQQGRESLQKMLNFLKAAEERGNPLPRAPSPFLDRYPLAPRG